MPSPFCEPFKYKDEHLPNTETKSDPNQPNDLVAMFRDGDAETSSGEFGGGSVGDNFSSIHS